MKKLILILGILALVAASCNKPAYQNNNNSNLQTYTNATYGFSFEYPNTMQFVTPTYPNLEDKVTQLQIPQSAYPGTNFGDAAISVSAQYAKSLQECLALMSPEGQTDGFKTKVNINGVDFYKTPTDGAAAGNRYEGFAYRTVKSTGGTCIEILETLHTSVIENYPSGTVTEVNKTEVQSKLDAVVNSFMFTQ